MHRTLTAAGEIFPLHTPFRISRGVRTAAQVVIVAIAQDGVTGRGECVPYPRYGENAESTILAIEAIRGAIEQGAGRQELLELMPAGAARNAVDCALWDLELRLSGSDIATALNLEKPLRPIVTAMTVSLDAPDHMAAAAAALADAPLLKVKVDRSDPAEQIKAVRAAAPKPKMIVDPNESWTIAEVRDLQGLLTDLRVDLLEQPLPADDDDDLIGFRSAIPIAGDEAVHVASDLDTLPDGYGVVNIKLDKTGGLTAALELAEAARARGLGVMTGCMICSSLSIAPAWAIAAQSSFVDLDGPLWLAEDRDGGVSAANGIMSPPKPGFWGGI
ncbi:L-alanine-DL-glutamate epimerase [Sphingopyxis sp. YR583]|jgi:L-alanine-DL-glutamate epimerase-like enolase superfamily enzyme|uniref:N-acetyl-D-Glu racemase DgcA n=1 Tax=Sphingopyxis sp. YR583 TaxID=1881047 RepID=UPI0008A7AB58|nr:N-acetyl-D-Glu racemase DgcA [Sphingopyxis sp. YR583]SEH19392.1 L-alanine-DL-glutamate epimerase [Sphingopyxis sp. YR583]